MRDEVDRSWWEGTWTEREDAMFSAFGPSHPPGAEQGDVLSFSRQRVPLPGACCYVFPPLEDGAGRREHRNYWLYVTHGLAQWLTREDMELARAAGNPASGAGVEFALITDHAAAWAPGVLQHIMSIDFDNREAGRRPFERGDRIPFYFESVVEGHERWAIGGLDGPVSVPADATRSLMFWSYLSPYAAFTTGSGSFELRVSTAITGPEWELAQETSTCHALLMLDWAGVGQRTRFGRASVTDLTGWERRWAEVGAMSF